jgi:hypothetical protein
MSISKNECIFFTGTQSDSVRELIAILRSAVSGADIRQEFNACAGQSPDPSIFPIPDRRAPLLNYSQRRILDLKKVYKLNLSATNAIMTLVQDPKFNAKEVGTNRVQNLDRILLRGYGGDVSEYDFHTAADGKQDLKMYIRGIDQVASEIFSDPRFKGSMTFTFVPTFDEEGTEKPLYYGNRPKKIRKPYQKNTEVFLLAIIVFIFDCTRRCSTRFWTASRHPRYGTAPLPQQEHVTDACTPAFTPE